MTIHDWALSVTTSSSNMQQQQMKLGQSWRTTHAPLLYSVSSLSRPRVASSLGRHSTTAHAQPKQKAPATLESMEDLHTGMLEAFEVTSQKCENLTKQLKEVNGGLQAEKNKNVRAQETIRTLSEDTTTLKIKLSGYNDLELRYRKAVTMLRDQQAANELWRKDVEDQSSDCAEYLKSLKTVVKLTAEHAAVEIKQLQDQVFALEKKLQTTNTDMVNKEKMWESTQETMKGKIQKLERDLESCENQTTKLEATLKHKEVELLSSKQELLSSETNLTSIQKLCTEKDIELRDAGNALAAEAEKLSQLQAETSSMKSKFEVQCEKQSQLLAVLKASEESLINENTACKEKAAELRLQLDSSIDEVL